MLESLRNYEIYVIQLILCVISVVISFTWFFYVNIFANFINIFSSIMMIFIPILIGKDILRKKEVKVVA